MLRQDLRELRQGLTRMGRTLDEVAAARAAMPAEADTEAVARLADAVENLVRQMREEQKAVRRWMEEQAEQNADLRRMVTPPPQDQRTATTTPPRGYRPATRRED